MFHKYNSFYILKFVKYRFPIVYHTPFFGRMKEETEKILNIFSFCDRVVAGTNTHFYIIFTEVDTNELHR